MGRWLVLNQVGLAREAGVSCVYIHRKRGREGESERESERGRVREGESERGRERGREGGGGREGGRE